MKSPITILCALLTASLLSACDPTTETPAVIPATTPSEKTISLIHLNDLHAHLVAHNELDRFNGNVTIKQKGGLPRIASAVKQLRQNNPNSILMNIGDTYHGGVEAFYTQGNAIVDPVNALNIDIGVPGNWDFAYGPSVTRLRYTGQGRNFFGADIKQVNYPSLAANVTSTTSTDFLPATQSITVDGIQIGFIGITSDIVPRMFAGFAFSFEFLQGKQNYIELINNAAQQLRSNGADVVVVMSELGIHKDIALANSIDTNSVSVFFSAHTHELTREPLQSLSGAIIVEAGNDTYLGHMQLDFDINKQLTGTRWEVLEIDESYAEDIAMQALVSAARAPFLGPDVNISYPIQQINQTLTRSIDTVLATSNTTLSRRQALESSFNTHFTRVLKQAAGTDIAMIAGFRYGSVIPEVGYLYEDNTLASGDITIEDAYRFFPVTLNLATGTVSGARLKSVIEENLTAVFSTDTFEHSGGWFNGFAGLDLTVDLAKGNNQRIVDIQLEGSQQSILDTEQLTIAGCARPFEQNAESVLCGFDGFTQVTPLINPATQTAWTAIDFLIDQLSNTLFTDQQPSHITDINNTQMWPNSDFVQPLGGAK